MSPQSPDSSSELISPSLPPSRTPLGVIANVSQVVSSVVDRISGDRVECPLLVAVACVEALKQFQIESQVMYGQVAWLEVLEDHSVIWAGCWGEHFHFWVATQFGEVVDLNTSVATRKRGHQQPSLKSIYSPPMLWSNEVPQFYRYLPEGVAELDLTDSRDQRQLTLVLEEVQSKCGPQHVPQDEASFNFANEPILCPGRVLLDDSRNTFRLFERAIAVSGIPQSPF
ncbi:MAG: hypothetical protein ACO3A2_11890 [Bdellovibrionia bacterium]